MTKCAHCGKEMDRKEERICIVYGDSETYEELYDWLRDYHISCALELKLVTKTKAGHLE